VAAEEVVEEGADAVTDGGDGAIGVDLRDHEHRQAGPSLGRRMAVPRLLVARSTRLGEGALVTDEEVGVRGSEVGVSVGARVGIEALMLASGNDVAAVLGTPPARSAPPCDG
jgi:hypothetical protein